jgi:site-specific recombinase XerD
LAGFRDIPIGDITRPMVRALAADLVGGAAAASSVHKTVGLLRQVLATAVADNLIAGNPAEGVELPTVRMTEQRFLTAAELHRLALAAGEHMPLVYVLGTTGRGSVRQPNSVGVMSISLGCGCGSPGR